MTLQKKFNYPDQRRKLLSSTVLQLPTIKAPAPPHTSLKGKSKGEEPTVRTVLNPRLRK